MLDAGRGLLDTVSCIGDAQRLFAQLASDGIRDEQPQVITYEESCGAEGAGCLRELVSLVFKDAGKGSYDSRSRLYSSLLNATARFPSEQRKWFIENDPSLAATCDRIVDAWLRARSLLNARNLTAPTVVLLSRECSDVIRPGHGWSTGGNGLFLCPQTYYYQILWHELLHEIFDLDECYDPVTRARLCEEPGCIMQWEPAYSDPQKGEWLCSRQRKRLAQRW